MVKAVGFWVWLKACSRWGSASGLGMTAACDLGDLTVKEMLEWFEHLVTEAMPCSFLANDAAASFDDRDNHRRAAASGEGSPWGRARTSRGFARGELQRSRDRQKLL